MTKTQSLRSLVGIRARPCEFQDLVQAAVSARDPEQLRREIRALGLVEAIRNTAKDAGVPNSGREAAAFVASFSVGAPPM